jgi:hypothetical protein
MSQPKPPTYKTLNWPAYNQSLCERGSLSVWFDPEMEWYSTAVVQRGPAELFSDEAIQCCLMLKNLFQLPLRQTTGLVSRLLKVIGLNWAVPDFSTLSRRQKYLKVRIPYRRNAQGLHLLVDSTGIKILGEGEWKTKKHGAEYRRQWRKIHLGIDAETLEIRAIEVTSNKLGDAQMLPGLLEQIPEDENLQSVSGDGIDDTKGCYKAITDRGSQYCSKSFRALIKQHGLVQSMSRKGNCWDNAVAESFFATLKRHCVHGQPLKTRAQMRLVVFEFIEVYYNRVRRHSANGWQTPVEFERLYHQTMERSTVHSFD